MSDKAKLRQWAIEQSIRLYEIGDWPPVIETVEPKTFSAEPAEERERVMSVEERWQTIHATAVRMANFVES